MLRSSVMVSVISIVSYLASFVNQLLIAQFFGASIRLDAYLVAMSVPFLFITATGGLFSYSLVPILVQKRISQPQSAQFSSLLLICVIILSIFLPCIAFFITPIIVQILVPTYSDSLKAEVLLMSRVMWLTYACAIVSSYLTCISNAAKKFYLPTLTSILPYLGMIVFSILWWRELGPLSLVLGMLVGYMITIPLLYWGVRREFAFTRNLFSFWHELSLILRRMPLVLFSLVGLSMYGAIDAIWVSRLGANNFSYLGYGQRLLIAMGNTILLGPITVLLPYLSEAIAQDRLKEFRGHTLSALRMLIFFFSMVGIIVSILSVPLVKLLFERGAFDRVATIGVSSIMPGLSIGVTAMVTVILLFRGLYAKGDIKDAGASA